VRRPALWLVAGIAATVGVLLLVAPVRQGAGHLLSLVGRGDLGALREYLRGFGVWAPVVSCVLMQVQAVLAPLPSFPIMYVNGALFGTLWGGFLSWVSLLLSAVLCFGLGRTFGRPLVEGVVNPGTLAWADQAVARFGPFAVFLARLVPFTAFDLLSYAAGLTPMRLVPFSVATGLGMAPAIFLSAAAGDIGIRSPWGLVGGLLAIVALAGLAALCRPVVLRWASARDREFSGPT